MLTGQNLKFGHSHCQSRRRKCPQTIWRQISYLRREMRWSPHSYYRMTLITNTGSRDQKVLKLCVEVTPPVPRTVTLAASCLTTIKQVRRHSLFCNGRTGVYQWYFSNKLGIFRYIFKFRNPLKKIVFPIS